MPRSRWTSRSYALHRQYCPPEEVQRFLESYRVSTGAIDAVLVSFDQRAVLRTLTFAIGENSTQLTDALERPVADEPALGHHPFWRPISVADTPNVLRTAADPKARYLGPDPRFFRAMLDLGPTAQWTIDRAYRPDEDLAINCIIFRRGGEIHPRHSDFALDMATRINCTLNASIYRDSQVTSKVDQALRRLEDDRRGADVPTVAGLVGLAKEVTSSEGAAFYRLDMTGDNHSSLVADVIECDDQVRIAKSSHNLPHEQEPSRVSTLAESFVKGRPIVYHRPATRASLDGAWVTPSGQHSELATPIPAAPGGLGTPGLGVLTLCRHVDGGGYGEYELALARNVALRISLLTSATTISTLSSIVRDVAAAVALPWAAEEPDPRDYALLSDGLPADFSESLDGIGQILVTTSDLLRAHSATMRFLVPTLRGISPIQVLQRAVVWPASRRDDKPLQITLDQRSVNAWVATNGLPVYLTNTRDSAASAGYPGLGIVHVQGRGSKSELCLPVFMDSRLIGTLNFESPRVSGFDLVEPLGEAAAALVALHVHGIRRRHLKDILALSEDVQAQGHNLLHLRDELATLVASDLPDSTSIVIHDAVDTLTTAVAAIAPKRADEALPIGGAPSTLLTILKPHIDGANFAVNSKSHDVNLDWSALARSRVELVLNEVFDNARRNRLAGHDGQPWVRTYEYVLSGRSYAEIVLEIPFASTREPPVELLYRLPVMKSDRVHFGAVTAGVLARSMGGDIVATLGRDNRVFISMSIPVLVREGLEKQ